MNIVTVREMNQDVVDGLYKIPRNIDAVVGIPRSGMLVASLIAVYMNKPLTDLDAYINGRLYESGHSKDTSANCKRTDALKRILIVEDSSSSGTSIRQAKCKVNNMDDAVEKIYFAAYVTKEAAANVDLYLRVIEQPRMFEWNYMHHMLLEKACVDIDGVLCVDPKTEENDDGENYINFILNAAPKLIPTRKVGWIVTARLEKYRSQTKRWLEKYKIEYDHLIMMGVETAEERQKLGNHAKFKGEVFRNETDAVWFIESDENQAKEIAEISGKTVFCVNSTYVYQASAWNMFKEKVYRRFSAAAHKILPPKAASIIRKWKTDRKYMEK